MKFFINLKRAFLGIGRKGQHNMVKILCLGVGLAVGAVLISKVYFDQSYDTFIAGSDRTYIVNENVIQNGKFAQYPQTSGAIAPGIKRYAPQVEAATRFNRISEDCSCETTDKVKIKANVALADSNFFDVVTIPVLQGNAKEVLSRPLYCMVSKKLAEQLGGNVIGKQMLLSDCGNFKVTIGGVYKDIPLNSSMSDLNILVALSTLKKAAFDGSNNWIGNDSYVSLIRLARGCRIDDIKPQVAKMIRENLPLDELKKAGVEMSYSFTPITSFHQSDPMVKKMAWILSLLATILIFSAVMNYLLIVIGNMVIRSKEMAVRKCYGGERKNIHSIIFSEALVHLILSIALSVLLIIVCRGTIEQLVGAPIQALLLNKGSWILLVICLVVLFLAGIVPGWLYSSIPVSTAFRGYIESRRHWKQALLALQIAAAGFLFCLLFIINKQYSLMINKDLGYSYSNIAIADLRSLNKEEKPKAVTELKKLAGVEDVTSAYVLPFSSMSGNNVFLPGDEKEYMNIADFYDVGDSFLKDMNIKILQGNNFTEQVDSLPQVMVSHSFVEKMKVLAHWDDNAVGRKVIITEHSHNGNPFTICGVYNDVTLNSMASPDERPSVMFYSKQVQTNLLIKFQELTAERMQQVQQKLKELYPDTDIPLVTYSSQITNLYQAQSDFRKAVLIGGIVTLFIALIGLLGYTNDEVLRRQKEIAIRKVNGAEINDILRLFVRDTLYIALPSIIIGCIGALLVARKWLEQFSEKASLSFILFLGSGLVVLFFILLTVYFNCRKIANSNPVEFIKGE